MAPTLRIPTAPNFPLSSPITEEIPSPTSSSPEREVEGQDQDRSQSWEVLESSARQTPRIHAARRAAHRSHVAETDHSHVHTPSSADANASSSRRPPVGLNLITDFSSLSVPKPKKRSPTFVDLSDLKTLCRKRERERSAQKIKGILKKRSEGVRGVPDEALLEGKRASVVDSDSPDKKRKDELSPFDRRVAIGLTISRAESDEQDKSRERVLDVDNHTPITPSIIVTPARENSFWEDDEPIEHPRPRVASSVYSQPTPSLDYEGIPPVPAIPANHSTSRLTTPILQIATPNIQVATPNIEQPRSANIIPPHKSRYSTATIFENDSPQSAGQSQSRSSENSSSRDRECTDRLSRLSVNTDTNRHQSQGWWTYLLSPLLKRSSTATKTPTTPDKPSPLREAHTPLSSSDWWEKGVSCFSPDTPELPGLASDMSPSGWQTETNPFADGNVSRIEEAGADTKGDIFAGQVIQGCAAEYYQACAHELFSGTPYFECQNHVCSITPMEKIAESKMGIPMNGNKGLALVEMDESTFQSPSSKAPSRTHHFSGSTAINDRGDGPFSVKGIGSTKLRGHSPVPTTLHLPGKQNTLAVAEKGQQPTTPITPFFIPPVKEDKINSISSTQQTARPATPVTPFFLPTTTFPRERTAQTVTVERAIPHYIVVPQNGHQGQPQSPAPISPAFQQATERTGIPMKNMHGNTKTRTDICTSFPRNPDPATTRGVSPFPQRLGLTTSSIISERERVERKLTHHEKEKKTNKEYRGGGGGGGICGCLKCLKNCFDGGSGESKRRRWYMIMAAIFLIILIIALLLAVLLSKSKGHGGGSPTDDPNNSKNNDNTTQPGPTETDDTPIQSNWLNLTGYPPIPTGVSTIAGPKSQKSESGCIHPTTLWSCALPKEMQKANKPFDADEPSFKVLIRFRNGTYAHSTALAARGNTNGSESGDDAAGGGGSWDPSPSSPSEADQEFLGNTTDGNVEPFAGEETPFYMTFLSTISNTTSSSSSSNTPSSSADSSSLSKRTTKNSFPNLTSLIPPPATQPNNHPSPATLHPLPKSQPVRLYNRGKDTEHYGFYTYFDKRIFLQSTAPLNGSIVDDHPIHDRNGGATSKQARTVCTWAQTRFLVQIWTKPGTKTLLQPSSTGTSDSDDEYGRPGTFPYPVTLTLDRHGGSAQKKMVYCYAINDDGTVDADEVKLQVEERGYNGRLIDAAPGIFNSSAKEVGDGVDGGDGGCGCEWANWVSLT